MGRRARILAAAAVLLIGIREISAQSHRATKKPSCPEGGGPLSLAQVIDSLYTTATKRCLVEVATKRGLSFAGTPMVLDLLRTLDTPPDLFPLIKAESAAPKPKLSGPLTVTCEPKDCEVIVENRYVGLTEQGKRVISGFAPGEVSIQVRSEGQENESRRVELQENVTRQEKFSLKPNALARRQAGRDLLLRVVAAFGGVDGLANMAELEGSGSVLAPDEWELGFSQRWTSANLSFKSKKGECNVAVVSGKGSAECKGKLKRSAEEARVARAGDLFEKYQLPVRVAQLLTRSVTMSRDSADTIETDDGPDSYTLTIGSDGHPSELVYREKADAAPVKITYSNYLSAENHFYPGQTVIPDEDPKKAVTYKVKSARTSAAKKTR